MLWEEQEHARSDWKEEREWGNRVLISSEAILFKMSVRY